MKHKGFTLVEIIVALAIVGILAVSFLPMFTLAFKTVFSSGYKSEEIFHDQKSMENLIADPNADDIDSLSIAFPDGYIISVEGQEMTNGEFKMFMPER